MILFIEIKLIYKYLEKQLYCLQKELYGGKEFFYFLFYYIFSEQFFIRMLLKYFMFESKLNYKCIVEVVLFLRVYFF